LPRDDKRLAALGVNTIRELPQLGHVVWGVRALDMSGEWKYVSVPRVALYLDESLNRGTRWVVFEPNDEPLWARIRLSVEVSCTGSSAAAPSKAGRRARPSS